MSAMRKRFISLVLLLTLGGGVVGGMPLHSNEEQCAHGMSGMDCCKTAQGHGNDRDIAAARVCCAVNCPQSGTTGPSGLQVPKASTVPAPPHPAVVHSPLPLPNAFIVSNWAHGPPPSSNPAYIRNLALLI